MPLIVLRWSLAVVLGAGALALLIRGHRELAPAATMALACVELGATVLFVVPRTARLGALGLVAALVAATAIHLVLGQPPPPSFAVYGAAIWVLAAPRGREGVA